MPLDTVLLELGSKGATHVGRDVFFKTVFPALRKARVWAPFLGVALVILNVQLPHVVINSLDLIGRATTGISLFVVGLIISQGAVELSGAVAIDVFLKNLVHPAVMLAAVVARPDPKWGETPCAFLELKPGASQPDDKELIAFCQARLARFKVPKTFVYGALPKTSTGKIQKFMLRDQAGAL